MKVIPLSKSRRLWIHFLAWCKSLLTKNNSVLVRDRFRVFGTLPADAGIPVSIATNTVFRTPVAKKAIKAYNTRPNHSVSEFYITEYGGLRARSSKK